MDEPSGTSQQLPFTIGISDWLRSEAARNLVVTAGGPIKFLLIVFGLASVLPAIFSAVLLPQGQAYKPSVMALWVLAWAIGAIIAYVVLSDAAREGRDLRGGVFLRWTGPYDVRIVGGGRGGSAVQFTVAGRNLQTDNARPLYSIQSGRGSIDYLPISGVLLEVRDESGKTLWSRVPTVP